MFTCEILSNFSYLVPFCYLRAQTQLIIHKPLPVIHREIRNQILIMNDIDNTSLEKLNKKLKITTTGTIILALVIVIFYVLMVMDFVKTQEFNSMLIIPIASTFIVISHIMKIKALRNEIKSKNNIT